MITVRIQKLMRVEVRRSCELYDALRWILINLARFVGTLLLFDHLVLYGMQTNMLDCSA